METSFKAQVSYVKAKWTYSHLGGNSFMMSKDWKGDSCSEGTVAK